MRRLWPVTVAIACLWFSWSTGALAATPNDADLRDLRKVIQQVIQAMGRAKRAFVFPREMRDIAWVQLRAGDISGALRTGLAIPHRDYHWRDDVLVEVAPAQAKRDDTRRAVQTTEMIVEPAARVAALRLIAKEQARAGDQAGAFTTFRQALMIPAAIQDRMVRDLVLGDFAAAKAGAGDTEEALRMATTIEDRITRREALAAIAVARAQAGDVADALRAVGAIQDPFLRASALQELADVLVKTGSKAGAALVAEEAIHMAAADPNLMWYPGNLLEIASAQAEAGDRVGADKLLREAERIAASLPDGPTKADAFVGIAEVLTGVGDESAASATLGRALQVAKAIPDNLQRAFAFASIASAQIERGDRHAASGIIGEAIQAALAIPDASKKKDEAFVNVARAQAKAGDLLEAIQTGVRVQDPLRRAHLFLEIAGARLKAGSRVASPILQEALQAASSILDKDEKHHVLQRAGCLQAKGGDLPAALQTVVAIQGDSDRVFALVSIAVTQAEAGDHSAAGSTLRRTERMAMAIPDKEEERSGPVLAIAQGWEQIGGSSRALAWANRQASSRLKLWALIGVAKGLAFRIIEPLEPDLVDRPLTLRAGYGC